MSTALKQQYSCQSKITSAEHVSAVFGASVCIYITPPSVIDQMEVSTTGNTNEHHQQARESDYYLINQSSH